MPEAIRYIGIARKAGAIELGETNAGAAVRAGKAKLLILASDASDNARRRAENFVYGTNTLLTTAPYTKEELSDISGAGGCSMAVFTDTGLAAAFTAELAGDDPAFSETANKLAELSDRQRRRQLEKAAHERNKTRGKSAVSGKRRKKQ